MQRFIALPNIRGATNKHKLLGIDFKFSKLV